MIEKIRVSLWDILTFFLSGLVFACWALSYALLTKAIRGQNVIEYVVKLPNSVILFVGPLLLAALGLLLEPIANYFDKTVTNLFWFKLFPRDEGREKEEHALREIIRATYLGPLKDLTSD